MRLVQVVYGFTAYRVFLQELARAAVQAGHPTAVVCGDIPACAHSEDQGGVRLLPLTVPRGSNLARHWVAARALRRILKNWQADVVHAHFSASMFSTALALRRGDPWLSFGTFHGLSFPLSRGRKRVLLRAAEVFAASRFDRVRVLTTDDRDALRSAAPSARVEVQRGFGIGCEDRFIDTPRVSDDERRDLRRAAGIPDAALILVFVGRLVAFKGFDFVVRTFWRFNQTVPLSRLIVVGEVDPLQLHPTGLSAEEWRRYLNDRDIVRAGTQRDVMPWLDLADVMVFPSEREGMPVCVMEALARGLPVLASSVRGCRELVVDGRNGFLIADRTESAWAERLRSLLTASHRVLAREDRESCNRFRRSHWVADALQSYKQALAAHDSVDTA